jgi:cysteine-rich repeat protein
MAPRPLVAPVVALIALAAAAGSADHPVGGARLLLTDPARAAARRIVFRSAASTRIAPSDASDPRRIGGTLSVSGSGATDGSSGTILLAADGWRGIGRPPGSKGYRFVDRRGTSGVRRVTLRRRPGGGTLSVDGGGRGWRYRVTAPQAAIDVQLALGRERFCARFTDLGPNRRGRVQAGRAAAPADCSSAPPAGCGDGVATAAEECDDGNAVSGDGCSASCKLESTAALCAGIVPVSGSRVAGRRIVGGLDQPVHLSAPLLDPTRLYVVEQRGRVRVIREGTLLPDPFLDIASRVLPGDERGLLSIAFHPAFEENGRFFLYYTDQSGALVIARYEAGANPDVADPATERILLSIPHPRGNHNGGQTAFGPDGYLYVGTGDGGGGGDPDDNGQNRGTLLGKMLRLDVNVDEPPYHRIPKTNPFVGTPGVRGEIWAWGLRNPWRFAFDRGTGDLYIGDVGQELWEEIDVQPAGSPGGENYGWDLREGAHCFQNGCSPAGLVDPVLEYGHDPACSVTGGFVYRGCRMPDLRGTYFYGDLCAAFVRTFRGSDATDRRDVTADLNGGGVAIDEISSFGEDARGELYVIDYRGEIVQVVPGS